MFGTKRARIGSLVAVLGTALGLAAAAAISGAAFARSVHKIAVERNGETRVIALDGVAEASYQASRAERPRRVVVDFDGVALDAAETQKTVFDGLVEEVTLAAYQSASGHPATRLEVTLASDADFTVGRDGDRLLVTLRPAQPKTASAAPAAHGDID